MTDVVVLLLEDGHVSTAVGPLEVFREAGVAWGQLTGGPVRPRFRVRSASLGGRTVRANGPVAIRPDDSIEAIRTADLIFVPSGGQDLDGSLRRNRRVIDFVRRMHSRGARIAGVCSGVGLLAASGILDGRRATTHWGLAALYRERFPAVDWRPDAMVTEADGIYCGGGVHAALDLALYLVERIEDRATAVECAKSLLIDMPRASQAGFGLHPLSKRHDDEAIRRAEDWLREHFGEEFRFDQVAERLGMSPRNFIRRFKLATGCLPIEYLQRLRVETAKRFLEEGRASVQELGLAVGYADAAFFRALFRRHTGLSPAAYRRRFGAPAGPGTRRLAPRPSRRRAVG